jgi:DNA-binding NarL/FixJ family response regulator
MKSLSVLVADHHPLFAEGIRTVLSAPANQLSFRVTAVARTTEQVEGYLAETRTDLLLLDPNLPTYEDGEWLGEIKNRFNGLRILFFAHQGDPAAVSSALSKGADGYLLKTASKDELRKAIAEITEGRQYVGRGIQLQESGARDMLKPADPESNFARKFRLTRREIEIIRHIGQAMTNKQIAECLFISDQTVSVHRKNIMRKLRVNSTASLIKMVYDNQLLAVAR